jgi:hypothetical protein
MPIARSVIDRRYAQIRVLLGWQSKGKFMLIVMGRGPGSPMFRQLHRAQMRDIVHMDENDLSSAFDSIGGVEQV